MSMSHTPGKGFALRNTSMMLRLACILFVLGMHGLLLATMLEVSPAVRQAQPEVHTVAAILLTEAASSPASQALPAMPVQQTVVLPSPPPAHSAPPLSVVTPEQPAPLKQKPVIRPAVTQTKPRIAAASEPPASAVAEGSSKTTAVPDAAQTTTTASTASAAAMIEPGVHCPQPAYPKMSRRLHEEGLVTLRFLVGTDGRVLQTEIAKTSGFSRLDDAARNALSQCQFRPAMYNGQATQSWTAIKYLWRLE